MLEFIGNLVNGFGSMVQNLVNGIGSTILGAINGLLNGVVLFLTRIVESFGGLADILTSAKNGLVGIYTGFLSLVSVIFPFLPEEWVAILVTSFLLTVVGIIIKKKVFE